MSKFTLLLTIIVVTTLALSQGSPDIIDSRDEGTTFYELNQGNLSITFSSFGARIVSLSFPDKHGRLADIVLGHDTLEEYELDRHNLGAIIGRVTGVMEGAEFTLNGTHYNVTANMGKNSINGGHRGFNYMDWNMTSLKKEESHSEITFTYKSYDGEEGFPGNITVVVKHTVKATELVTEINGYAENKATPVNIGQLILWNLGGHDSGEINGHDLQIFGSKIVEINPISYIPSGKILPVQDTPYDFIKPHPIGSRINKTFSGLGYRNNYVLNGGSGFKKAAILYEKKSGRILRIWTTQPTLHFLTCNDFVDIGKGGFLYQSHYAVGLDPHGYPDFLHHPNFPSTILTPGKVYKQKNIYEFSVRPKVFV